MLEDAYGNPVSTQSAAARDAYSHGVASFLTAQADAEAAFERAIAADPDFALAHIGLARARQSVGKVPAAREALAKVAETKGERTARERSHIDAFTRLISGDGPGAYKAIRRHAPAHPRDVMIVQTCMGVFGLIGFSGQSGREAEQLAFSAAMEPHYPDDSWFQCQHAFAMSEAGQVAAAMPIADRAFELNQKNAHAAHVRGHVMYEAGDIRAGYDFIRGWRPAYDKGGALHCHISWHQALWALEHGDIDDMWSIVDADIAPGKTWGPGLNVLTDTAAILYRAKLAGVDVPQSRWLDVSRFAQEFFPNPGVAFGDAHAALAHAMAGETDALRKIISDARGPAAEVVRQTAAGFEAIGTSDWASAVAELGKAMTHHERLGGSRAQRDLLEYAYVNALMQLGQTDEAKRLLGLRRPANVATKAVKGLH